MEKPSRELPSCKFGDWRDNIRIKRFELSDSRRAIYYIESDGASLILTERRFRFLAGLMGEELGRVIRNEGGESND